MTIALALAAARFAALSACAKQRAIGVRKSEKDEHHGCRHPLFC